jgi:hypothetical protein
VETIHGKILLKTFTPITKKEMMAHFALHSKASTAIIHYSFFSQKTTKFSNFVLFSKKKNNISSYTRSLQFTFIRCTFCGGVHFTSVPLILSKFLIHVAVVFSSIQHSTILRYHFLSILFFVHCWSIDAI